MYKGKIIKYDFWNIIKYEGDIICGKMEFGKNMIIIY